MTEIKGRYIGDGDHKRQIRHSDYEHTISGLLHKRVDLFHEAERIRDRLAAIKNDTDALDRTLGVLGYDGDLDAAMPRQKRHVIFGRGELTRQVLTILRRNAKPLTSRQIAQEIVSDSGMDGEGPQIRIRPHKARGEGLQTISRRDYSQGYGRAGECGVVASWLSASNTRTLHYLIQQSSKWLPKNFAACFVKLHKEW